MQTAVTSPFTFQDYLYLKNINKFLVSELCFPDKDEPTEENFKEFKEKHFMKLVQIKATYAGNIENTIYVSIVFGYCYFVIIEDGKCLMDNNQIYKNVSNYFKKIDKMELTQKLKYFIFNLGFHNIETITSLAIHIALMNKSNDEVKRIIFEKYKKDLDENNVEFHDEKIAEFLDKNDNSIFLKYCSKPNLYLKILKYLFPQFLINLEQEFVKQETIDENMERIVFSKNFCLNDNVEIY